MIYGSVCSGIEAATAAWHPLGWTPAWFSEIDKFPAAVLAHHYPTVPNLGDMTTIRDRDDLDPIDLLVGGTPCQSFSVAGLRGGLADDRGNLALEFCRLTARLRPRWIVWENVPGVLSSHGGRDFASIVGALVELGYGCSWRVLDAQYFGVPQRRRRVFLVGHLGDWRAAGAVLLERESLRRNPPPSREAGQDPASRARGCPEVSYALSCGQGGSKFGSGRHNQDTLIPEVADPLCANDDRTYTAERSRNFRLKNCVAFEPRFARNGRGGPSEVVPPLKAQSGRTGKGDSAPCVAFVQNTRDEVRLMGGDGAVAGALPAQPGMKQQTYIREPARVRRLTPTECERLQGFPDGFTQIPWRDQPADQCPTGHRYKALGNSMAVPVMRWIGQRIQQLEDQS